MAARINNPVTNQSQKSGQALTSPGSEPQHVPAPAQGRPDPDKDTVGEYLKLPTTSARIRAMAADGYSRPQIQRALNLIPQHVRNVLVTPLKRGPR